jgi:tetratricopeptide (TPR) repeat protein
MMERLLEADRNLDVGFVDRAEGIFRQLADADPRNAVAVVGLARCALERGDEEAAYGLAVRALDIDPEDAVALRMEARLSEVLATRGRPVARPPFVVEPRPVPGPSAPPTDGTARATTPSEAARTRGRGLLRRILRRG